MHDDETTLIEPTLTIRDIGIEISDSTQAEIRREVEAALAATKKGRE